MAIKCYVKAANKSEAEQAAWDLDYTVPFPNDAEDYPRNEAEPKRPTRLYEVTITAKPMRKRATKKGGKS
jgi:hypothetical protein